MFNKLKKLFYLYILRRKYYRTGSCNACGRCCKKIYVKHKNVIQTEEEFKRLQLLHPFYTYLKIVDKDETGLVFECMNLDELEPIEKFEEVFEKIQKRNKKTKNQNIHL